MTRQNGEKAELFAPEIPAQRRDRRRFEQAAVTVQDWLEVHDVDDDAAGPDADYLRRLTELATNGAPDTEINAAVRQARAGGWGWGPIALLLDQTRAQARRRAD